MSENRVQKSIRRFYIDPKEVQNRKTLRKPVILADSKGNYIQRQITSEHCLNTKFFCHKGWTIQECINWAEKHLPNKFDKEEKLSFYIWLGTCDLTYYDKSTKFISLEDDKNDRNITYIIRKFNELKEFITSQFARSEVVFLEVPSISIQHWNHSRGHKNYKEFIEQDKKLELMLDQLNNKIRQLNNSVNRSPHFMLDLWRSSKGHKKKSPTKTYTYLNLLEKDGVHPKPALARLWMRRIATKIYEDCFSKIPKDNLW